MSRTLNIIKPKKGTVYQVRCTDTWKQDLLEFAYGNGLDAAKIVREATAEYIARHRIMTGLATHA